MRILLVNLFLINMALIASGCSKVEYVDAYTLHRLESPDDRLHHATLSKDFGGLVWKDPAPTHIKSSIAPAEKASDETKPEASPVTTRFKREKSKYLMETVLFESTEDKTQHYQLRRSTLRFGADHKTRRIGLELRFNY